MQTAATYTANNMDTQEVTRMMSNVEVLPREGAIMDKLTAIQGTSKCLCRNFRTTSSGVATLGFKLGKEEAVIDTDERTVTIGLNEDRFRKACESGNVDDQMWYASESLAGTCLAMGDRMDELEAKNAAQATTIKSLIKSNNRAAMLNTGLVIAGGCAVTTAVVGICMWSAERKRRKNLQDAIENTVESVKDYQRGFEDGAKKSK